MSVQRRCWVLVLMAVLSLLSKERGVYGLRNGDYDKYRRHCSNKIHRLRVVTGSTCGKHKVYKKPGPINKETVKDIKCVNHNHAIIPTSANL